MKEENNNCLKYLFEGKDKINEKRGEGQCFSSFENVLIFIKIKHLIVEYLSKINCYVVPLNCLDHLFVQFVCNLQLID